ncbi:MAG TPA: AraC family transcriptional regulator [Phototrophicaceae bacterium]|jgi:AraC-like DNA-binding protein|nr:AraC family transcriptional regulator [Phototrophicaceae bacterium]
MTIYFEERPSDSPLIEQIWRSSSTTTGPFISTANVYWMLVVCRYRGKTKVTVRGPETLSTTAYALEHGFNDEETSFLGIVFKPGIFMPHLPPGIVADQSLTLPEGVGKSFRLYGSTWEFPTFDNVDTFITRLMRTDMLVQDPVVAAALQGQAAGLTQRTMQKRFLRATGISHNAFRQIERANQAFRILQQGTSILDTVYSLGYFDQPHLTRSLKRLMGQTPAQIARSIPVPVAG